MQAVEERLRGGMLCTCRSIHTEGSFGDRALEGRAALVTAAPVSMWAALQCSQTKWRTERRKEQLFRCAHAAPRLLTAAGKQRTICCAWWPESLRMG